MKLSVCYIIFNGERIIEKSIRSVYEIADEIIVVDSFSMDKTEEICTGFPKVKFIKKKFEGFGDQKNYTLAQTSGEWILFLDSDEVPDATAVQAIKDILNSSSPAYKVYTIHFNNILLKKTIRYGGWGTVWRERFFKKGHGKYSDDLVHESFITQDKIGKLPGNIDHYTYKSIAHHIEKINNYTQLMAEKKVANGKKVSLFKIIFSPFFDFMKTYFFKLGFMDGVAGFYISVTGAFYTFLKYIKINEILRVK
ncbi:MULTISPECIES: glycosyltransferase family 2 protein [Chryseobacterium]|uniref:glycosyltransferase family 2 protein n=1 Tax=Chryseobacterium TaxID=59732 RepID=UPI0012967495|nr:MULTISPECIES: glycosyltransferase family 2 protein [Chryseobacterium]MDR6922190.1 glycosyltransferase involved in cell wall biosynthesis [Chryseobacterium sp. 2987]